MSELFDALIKNHKEYLVLLVAVLTFVLTTIKERYNSRKSKRPFLQVTRTTQNYGEDSDILRPGIRIQDKYHTEFLKMKEEDESLGVDFLVVKNISENIALSIYIQAESGYNDDIWKKEFAVETLLPDHYILVPLGTPEAYTMLDDRDVKISYKTIDNEKLSYENTMSFLVRMDKEKPKSKYNTVCYKYWFGFVKIPYMRIKDSDFFTFKYL